ncbi:Increased rDNA silencing protein, partial [Oleoguttula sp. CCFEE 5521]
RNSSRAPSIAVNTQSPQGTTPNAALMGAALAFGRPALPQRQSQTKVSSIGAVNGAYRAGQSDGASRPTGSAAPLSRQSTGQSLRQVSGPLKTATTSTGRFERATQDDKARIPLGTDVKSRQPISPPPALESTTSKPANGAPAPPLKPRRLSQQNRHNVETSSIRTDDSSIAPTTSLVHLFESKAIIDDTTPKGKERPISLIAMGIDNAQSGPTRSPTLDGSATSRDEPYFSAPEDAMPTPVTVRKQRSSNFTTTLQPPTPTPRKTEFSQSRSPTRPGKTAAIDISNVPRGHPAPSPPPLARSSSIQSGQSITATYHQMYQRRQTPLTTGDDIANAIVASSLASSRAGSPRMREASLAPPSLRHGLSTSRTSSPVKKGMRHTLREAESESSESDDEMHPYGKHKRKRHLRKHPNKHHEGDRKRWREAVTERERKRYEGVWAANRGLYCFMAPTESAGLNAVADVVAAKAALSDQVSSIVVRDIWNRCRLPAYELEAVWDLVASTPHSNRLSKEEFVVGFWLIDQRLKGRKLPVKVSPTVWASVRGVEGIKIKKYLG